MPSTLEPSSSRRRRRGRAPSTGRAAGGTPAGTTPAGPSPGSSPRGRCAPRAATSSPAMPASSSSFSVPWTASARGGVAEVVGDEQAEVPVVDRVRLGVAGHEQRRRLDVAVLLDAQVELEVGPVGRQRVEDLLEGLGKRHDWPRRLHGRLSRGPGRPARARARPEPRRPAAAARAARRRRGGRGRAIGARRPACRASACSTSSSARSSGGWCACATSLAIVASSDDDRHRPTPAVPRR